MMHVDGEGLGVSDIWQHIALSFSRHTFLCISMLIFWNVKSGSLVGIYQENLLLPSSGLM
jgi:hypothetical protein